MDEEILKSWAVRPDGCRCCLSACGAWDMSITRITDSGVKEIYADILQECYGINLSQTSSSQLACEVCISRLRDAYAFRKQVITAEEVFMQCQQDALQEIKMELEEETAASPGMNEDVPSFNDDDNYRIYHNEEELKTSSDTEAATKKKSPRKKLKTAKKTKKVKERKTTKEIRPLENSSKDEKTEENECDIQGNTTGGLKNIAVPVKKHRIRLKLRNGVLKRPKFTTKMSAESYIDNRQLRSNITLILKNSTVVPFKFRGQKFHCFYCTQDFFQYNELKQHTITNHSNLSENEILLSLKQPKSLINADVSEIKCLLCEKNTKSVEELTNHFVTIHKKLYHDSDRIRPSHGMLGFDMSSDKYKCAICRLEFDFFKCLTAHMNEHSNDFICPSCGKSFVSDIRLQGHVMRNHNISDDDKTCKLCLKQFSTIGRKEYHIRTVHMDTKLKCSECDLMFPNRLKRLKHMADVHKFEMPKYQCNVCMKEFSSLGCLRTHTKSIHVKDKAYPCEICGKSYFRRSVWKRHLKGHNDKDS